MQNAQGSMNLGPTLPLGHNGDAMCFPDQEDGFEIELF